MDKATGNRVKGDEDEVEDKSGTPILTGELENGAQYFVIKEVELILCLLAPLNQATER
jgi:hypothetical protein